MARQRRLRAVPSVKEVYAAASPYPEHAEAPAEAESVRRFVEFVRSQAVPGTVLEVGCGSGPAIPDLVENFQVVSTDISLDRLKAARARPGTHQARFAAADVSRLPFTNSAFDNVSCHQLLEHLSKPERALGEMARVLRPGGSMILVGPNLLSPLYSARALLEHARAGRWARTDRGNRRFPFGGNVLESAWILLRNAVALSATVLVPARPLCWFRTPDMRPPVHADSDAVYLATGTDIVVWAGRLGLRRLPGRSRARHRLGRFSGSYWLAFTKPEASG
jgi:SAM-dependent methyltransferase